MGILFWIVIFMILMLNIANLVRANITLDKQEEILDLLKKFNNDEENK